MITLEQLEKRIAELKILREQFLAQANTQLGDFSGRIAELEKLVADMKQVETNAPPNPAATI